MHPALRTLDFTTGVGAESSVYDLHPIRDTASPRSRGIPFMLSLGLTPLLIYGLSISLISPTSRQAVEGANDQARRSVALLLFEPNTSGLQSPGRNPSGREEPRAAGHREGTNTLDPRLSAYTSVLTKPSDAADPDELGTSIKAERISLSLNPALPPQAGGNGLARGTGRVSANGAGGTINLIETKAFDFQLIVLKEVQVRFQLLPDETDAAKEPVRVRILIGDDGVPFQAMVISGPIFLHEETLKAARQWRFESLAAHGLKGPVSLVIAFYPTFLKPRKIRTWGPSLERTRHP